MVKMTEKGSAGKNFPAEPFFCIHSAQKRCQTFVKFVHTSV